MLSEGRFCFLSESIQIRHFFHNLRTPFYLDSVLTNCTVGDFTARNMLAEKQKAPT